MTTTGLFVLLFASVLWTPTFTYRVIEVPGAWETYPTDINNNSHIAGYYKVKTQIPTLHGFIYDGTGFVTIDYPGAFNTRVHAISDAGDVCGDFTLAAGTQPYHGFVRSAAGDFRELTIPGAIDLRCEGLNNRGDAFGVYALSAAERYAFILKESLTGSGTEIVMSNVPGATSSTEPREINDAMQAVGYFMNGGIHGFLRSSDGFITLTHPATAGVTQALGISDDGLIVGRWNDYTKNLGFIWWRGVFLYDQITVPTAQGLTIPFGVNRTGDIVGHYIGKNASGIGGTFGFVATPSSIFSPRVDRFTGLERLNRPRVPLSLDPTWSRPDVEAR